MYKNFTIFNKNSQFMMHGILSKEVIVMDAKMEEYREKIIEMVNEMENIDFLFKIYHYIIPKYKKEKGAVD